MIDRGTVIAEGTAAELKAKMGATVLAVALRRRRRRRAPRSATWPRVVRAPRSTAPIVRARSPTAPHAPWSWCGPSTPPALDVAASTVREPSLDDVFLTLTGHRAEVTTPTPTVDADRSDPTGDRRTAGAR